MRRKFYTILKENRKSLEVVPDNAQVVALQAKGTRPPFFMIDSYPYFIDVVKLTGSDQPVLVSRTGRHSALRRLQHLR